MGGHVESGNWRYQGDETVIRWKTLLAIEYEADMWVIRALHNVVRLYKKRPIQSKKFRKLTGILQMEFYGDASQKHRSTIGQVGIKREKDSEKVATIHGQSKTIGRFQNLFVEPEAYVARLTSEECFYWRMIVLEVGLRYLLENVTVITDRKLKVTVDPPRFNKDIKLPWTDIAMVRTLIQFERIKL